MLDFEQIRYRVFGPDNSGLPLGARRFTNPSVDQLLRDLHDQEITHYFRFPNRLVGPEFGQLVGLEDEPVEISNSRSQTFNWQLHPIVDGSEWYRGFAIDKDEGQVILLSPWARLDEVGGSPDPIIYVRGAISEQAVLDVISKHTAGVLANIEEASTPQRRPLDGAGDILRECYMKAQA